MIGKRKILVVSPSMFDGSFIKAGCDVWQINKRFNTFVKIIKKIDEKFSFCPDSLWYDTNFDYGVEYDMVIVFDSLYMVHKNKFFNSIDKINSKRKIFYFWNNVSFDPKVVPSQWEKWTFDKLDAKIYGMRYGGTFYPINEYKSLNFTKNEVYSADVMFAGLDKGRKKQLDKLHDLFKDHDLNTRIMLMSRKPLQLLSRKYHKFIPYIKLLQYVNASKSIVEIMVKGQTGLTLRTMEALCFKKKLITDNAAISEYDFYNSDNVFIIGKDDLSNIHDFVNAPYREIMFDETKYDILAWIERLIGGIEFYD